MYWIVWAWAIKVFWTVFIVLRLSSPLTFLPMSRGVSEDIAGRSQEFIGGRDVGGRRAGLFQVQRLPTPPHGEQGRRERSRGRPRRGGRLYRVGGAPRDPPHGVRQLLLDLKSRLRNCSWDIGGALVDADANDVGESLNKDPI